MAFKLPDAAENLLPGDLISKAAGSPGESEVGSLFFQPMRRVCQTLKGWQPWTIRKNTSSFSFQTCIIFYYFTP